MAEQLGKIEKTEAKEFTSKKKLYLVPLLFSGKSAPEDYVEKYQRYWQQVSEHVANLEGKLGKVGHVYHESVYEAGKNGLEAIQKLNADSSRIAVEKSEADAAVIKRNIKKFGAGNVSVVNAFAPEGLEDLPRPAAVFIGGNGGKLKEIIGFVAGALEPGGRLVVNLVGLENLNAASSSFRETGLDPEITLISVARSTAVGELTRLAALNPVFIIAAVKGDKIEQ